MAPFSPPRSDISRMKACGEKSFKHDKFLGNVHESRYWTLSATSQCVTQTRHKMRCVEGLLGVKYLCSQTLWRIMTQIKVVKRKIFYKIHLLSHKILTPYSVVQTFIFNGYHYMYVNKKIAIVHVLLINRRILLKIIKEGTNNILETSLQACRNMS